eukprot:gene1288-1629_t
MIWRRVVRELSSLPRAIGIMAIITALSGLGTVVPQNKPYDYYITNYPVDGSKVLGFLDYNVLLTLQLDHIYSAWYFYACIALLAASLMACTYTTQLPTARKHGKPQVLPNAALTDLATSLISKSYQVFLQNGQLYAFKGLAGRLGPIGVHVALLMCIAGTAYSGFGGWKGSVMCPEGQEFVVGQAINPASALATVPQGAETVLQVNKFSIDTRPDGSVAQFYSDLTLRDFNGKELLRKTISVNDPFRYGGVTMYQTDCKGEFAGVRRAESGKVILVEGLGIVLEDIIGSTGLEIKNDPGVPLVYAGFGGLMITTLISYISHSQVWGLQEGSNVYVVGRSNRSKVLFERELDDVLD